MPADALGNGNKGWVKKGGATVILSFFCLIFFFFLLNIYRIDVPVNVIKSSKMRN